MSQFPGLPPLIPRSVLFGNPEKLFPKISSDGKKLAYVAPWEGVLNVWVGSLEKRDFKAITRNKDRGIRSYMWSEDHQRILYLQDTKGDENWRLYGVDLQTGESREYTPFEGVQVHLLEHNHHHPTKVLLMMNKENPQHHDVYCLDIETGDLERVAENPGHVLGGVGNVVGWLADKDLQVKCALSATPEGGFDLLVRDTPQEEWRKLLTWNSDDGLYSGPLSFSEDGKSLYLRDARGSNASRLVKVNITTGETEEVLLEDPQYDVDSVIFHPDRYTPQMAAVVKARTEWTVLDPAVKEDFQFFSKDHPGDFFLASRDRKDLLWLVGFVQDAGPVSYHIYDREKKEMTFLFHHRSDLSQYVLAPMESISFPSRDGYTIHGYISYPPGVERKNLPLVLDVHGGPWWRDTWGFHPEAQWLANRGYVCLQVNYRGSSGYGKDFLNAGNKEWGGKMHQDLVDAVERVVNQGLVDPQRMAIYGGSYGGYAALVGATFTPDLFRCAISVVGPSNLLTFIRTIPPYWKSLLGTMYQRVGNPDTEEEFLRSRSPLFKVDQIVIPLLVAQGANDPRVKQAESEQIVEALKQKGIPHEYLLFEDEGHGFARPENRLKFYNRAEEFLALHLGGRKEGQ